MKVRAIPLLSLATAFLAGCGAVSGLSGLTPAGDTTPPATVSTAPAADASVPADASIIVTFSKPMNTRSVVITAQPQISFGVGQWSTDERTVTFKPEAPLQSGTRYTASVTGKDRAGNAMAPFSWTFAATGVGARTGTGEVQLKDRIEARADERLFTLYAALNASGYDEGIKEQGPVREAVREKMGELPLKVMEPFRKFRSEHAQTLDAYIAYVLTLTPPPDLAEQRAPNGLGRLNRVLADFYSAAKIAELWKTYSETHAKAADSFASGGLQVMGKIFDYLRTTQVPFARIVLLPNLLDAPGHAYLIRSGDVTSMVIGTTGALDRQAVARLIARMVLGTAPPTAPAELQRTETLFDLVRETARKHGYAQWDHVVRESLVAAVAAQTTLSAEQREQFLRGEYVKGLILVNHFAGELAKYEQATIPLTEFLPQMLRTVNLDEERRKFAERR
ncbi:MAG: Ig-like domain-containing protein [bacterium]